jgi:hypothetical protein
MSVILHKLTDFSTFNWYGLWGAGQDLTYINFSLRVPDQPGRLPLKARNSMFQQVTASSLKKFELYDTPQ